LQQCAGLGGTIKSFRLDVTDEPTVEDIIRSIRLAFGAVDGLINKAGVVSDALLVKAVDYKVQQKMSLSEFNKVIVVDLIGVFLCGRAASPTCSILGGASEPRPGSTTCAFMTFGILSPAVASHWEKACR
jgi:NAD(P)-dependent dehydrogenase (short-subunit alcohol dehydrogenase family)